MIPSRMLASQAMGICLASGLLFSACDRAETALPVAPAGQESQVAAAAAKSPGKDPGGTWFQVKKIDFSFPFVLSETVIIPANATLRAVTQKQDGAGNPALVAFYKTTESVFGAFKVKVVGLNDDVTPPGLNAYFAWRNTTGSSKSVTVVGYASTPEQAGMGKVFLEVATNGLTHYTRTLSGYMSGIAVHNDDPVSTGACTGPWATRITLKNRVGGGFGSSVLAVNATTLNGGYIREEDNVLELKEVLPSGGAHLFLAFMEQQSSSILESTGFRATQENKYFCPAP